VKGNLNRAVEAFEGFPKPHCIAVVLPEALDVVGLTPVRLSWRRRYRGLTAIPWP